MEVVRELLKAGFTVGTFNLRGVGKSQGKSTWTSKAELQDYISFVGFFMYYLSGVYPPVFSAIPFDDFFGLAPVFDEDSVQTRPPARLVLAGYSYGALLTRHLPDVPAILSRFTKVLKTSTEAEIRRRAYDLASLTITDIVSADLPSAQESRKLKTKQSLDKDRATEGRNYMELLQKPFVRKEVKDSWPGQDLGEDPSEDDYIKRVEVPTPITNYLLISMLLGPVASVVTRFKNLVDVDMDKLDEKFQYNSTAVIHGTSDRMTSGKRLIRWVEPIFELSGGTCQAGGVAGAGHFWREKGAIDGLRKLLQELFQAFEDVRQESVGEDASNPVTSADLKDEGKDASKPITSANQEKGSKSRLNEVRGEEKPGEGEASGAVAAGLNTKENRPKAAKIEKASEKESAEASDSSSSGNLMRKLTTVSYNSIAY
ncbi:MAG: hypothetical protein Q9172_007431 [Xanthocarpia lactea]